MENKLHTFEKSLDKLNLVDVNKFSTIDFKSVNKDIETQLNNFKELLDLDNPANVFSDDQIQIKMNWASQIINYNAKYKSRK